MPPISAGWGLLSAFIVEPKDARNEPKVDLDYVMILNDSMHGYTVNGKSFPATEPLSPNWDRPSGSAS